MFPPESFDGLRCSLFCVESFLQPGVPEFKEASEFACLQALFLEKWEEELGEYFEDAGFECL